MLIHLIKEINIQKQNCQGTSTCFHKCYSQENKCRRNFLDLFLEKLRRVLTTLNIFSDMSGPPQIFIEVLY